jgi:hypothetical protein
MEDAHERPALYYPYIHIRSEHWLKATLMCVPTVKRIVPETYLPEDLPPIIKYTNVIGPNGPLLQAVPPSSPAAEQSQQRLLEYLREHEAEILRKYQRNHAPSHDGYWVHDAKFNIELLNYLRDHNLAWLSSDPGAYGHRTWYAVHPNLGSAIMTTLGLSIAREQHYDIVTPSAEFHEALLATRENEVFNTLLSIKEQKAIPTLAQVRHDLGQIVITMTGINYEALRPEDICELQYSKHFQTFQHLLRSSGRNVDLGDDPQDYEEGLKREAAAIIAAWHQTKSDISGGLKDILFETGLTMSGEALKVLIKGPEITDLAVAGGVAIALLLSRGGRFREKQVQANPYQYLTEITKAQNEALRLTFPLGLER